MKRRIWQAGLLAALVSGLFAFSSDGQSNKPKFPKPSRSNAVGRESELQLKFWEAKRRRDDVVEHAIYALTEMAPFETAGGDYSESLFVLSRFRATEGIEILSKRLHYEPENNAPRRTYDSYPASGALISIGQPAVPAMLRVIRDPKRNELERRIACYVLLSIEAKSDPDLATDDDIVKEMVLQRISRLQPLSDEESTRVEEARGFIEHFAETEGRWQELPVILNGPPSVTVGQPVQHQFQCQKPLEHPDAKIEFQQTEPLEELGLKLSKTGTLTGTPKAPGRYRLKIHAKATWTSSSGNDIESYGSNCFRFTVFSKD